MFLKRCLEGSGALFAFCLSLSADSVEDVRVFVRGETVTPTPEVPTSSDVDLEGIEEETAEEVTEEGTADVAAELRGVRFLITLIGIPSLAPKTAFLLFGLNLHAIVADTTAFRLTILVFIPGRNNFAELIGTDVGAIALEDAEVVRLPEEADLFLSEPVAASASFFLWSK